MTGHVNDRRSPPRRRPVVFTVLVFASSVPLWVLGSVVGRLPIPIDVPLSALQAFCPLLVAVILVRWDDGPGGARRLLRRLVDFGGPARWYLVALLLMPAVLTTSYLYLRLMGAEIPCWQVSPGTAALLCGALLTGAIGEEVGWSGYLIDALPRRWSALASALVVGTIWAVWHVVAWYAQSGHTLAWTTGQFVGSVAGRVLVVWLYNQVGGAVPIAVLHHAMINVSESLFPRYGSHYDPVSTAVILVLVAGAVTLLWGPRTLSSWWRSAAGSRSARRRHDG